MNLVLILRETVFPVRAENYIFEGRIHRRMKRERVETRRSGNNRIDAVRLERIPERFKARAVDGARSAATVWERVDRFVRHTHSCADSRRHIEQVGKQVAVESSVVVHAIEKGRKGLG